jgi:hypothetical protein
MKQIEVVRKVCAMKNWPPLPKKPDLAGAAVDCPEVGSRGHRRR